MNLRFAIVKDGEKIDEAYGKTYEEVIKDAKKYAPCVVEIYEEDGVCYHKLRIYPPTKS